MDGLVLYQDIQRKCDSLYTKTRPCSSLSNFRHMHLCVLYVPIDDGSVVPEHVGILGHQSRFSQMECPASSRTALK